MCTRCRQDVCLSCEKEKQRGTDMTGNYSLMNMRTSDLERLSPISHLKKKENHRIWYVLVVRHHKELDVVIKIQFKKKLRKINVLVWVYMSIPASLIERLQDRISTLEEFVSIQAIYLNSREPSFQFRQSTFCINQLHYHHPQQARLWSVRIIAGGSGKTAPTEKGRERLKDRHRRGEDGITMTTRQWQK